MVDESIYAISPTEAKRKDQ